MSHDEFGYFSLGLATALFTLSLSILILFKAHPNGRLPPGPRALPIIGHAHLLGPLVHQSFQALAQRYGPLMYLRLGAVPTIVVSSLEIAKEILKTHDLAFASRPNLTGSKEMTDNSSSGFVFARYGPYWRFIKKLCVTELLSTRQLDRFVSVRQEEIRRFMVLLLEKSTAGEHVDILMLLTAMTNNVVCRMAMSTRCSGSENEADECRKVVRELVEIAGKFNLEDFLGFSTSLDLQGHKKRQSEMYRKFDLLIERTMKEHEERRKKKSDEKGANDLMDILLEIAQDENAEMKLSRQNIKAFLLDIFVAGTETSAIAMQWALAELINHPVVFKKAREEIDSVVGKSRLVQESDIPNLPYLRAITKETFRLHPPAPFIVRESNQDCKIRGFDIPTKTRLFINIWAIGRDPNSWEDPQEFRPERFLSDQNQLNMMGTNFELLPFGGGRRACPGTPLALNMIHGAIAAMVQCFDWKVEGSKVDTKEWQGFTIPMAHSFHPLPISHYNPFASTIIL